MIREDLIEPKHCTFHKHMFKSVTVNKHCSPEKFRDLGGTPLKVWHKSVRKKQTYVLKPASSGDLGVPPIMPEHTFQTYIFKYL